MVLRYFTGLKYTPVIGKRPLLNNWQNRGMDYETVQKQVANNQATGYGLLLGEQSNGIMALDFDGPEAFESFRAIFATDIYDYHYNMCWSSNLPDRMQIGFMVPQEYWPYVKHMCVGTRNKLEFRWNGHQSVMPPSVHPDTGQPYMWITPPHKPIKNIPDDILAFWMEENLVTPQPALHVVRPAGGDADEDIMLQTVWEYVEEYHRCYNKLGYERWRDLSWAVAEAVGTDNAKAIMRSFYPEIKPGEYNTLLGIKYRPSDSPTIATLVWLVQQASPDAARAIKHKEFKRIEDRKLRKIIERCARRATTMP